MHENPNRNPLMIQHPSRTVVCAPSMGGKTLWAVSTILRKDSPWSRVIVMCHEISKEQELFKKLRKEFKGKGGVIYVNGLPQTEEEEKEVMDLMVEGRTKCMPTVIVVDDLMQDSDGGRGAKFLSRLFTASRHANCSVMNLIQTVMHSRRNRQNADYMVLFDFPSCADAVLALSRQLSPEDKGKRVMQAYRQATSKPYGYLLITTRPGSQAYRYRDSSFDRAFDFTKISIGIE